MPSFTANTTLSAAALNTAFNQADINVQTSTTYTLLLADQGKLITLDNGSAVTVTIPLNSSAALPTNTVIGLLNKGAGLATISPTAGVTLNPAVRVLAQNEAASLVKTDTNTWYFVQGGGLPKAIVSSSTAASVTAVTLGGLPAKVYKFTGTGSITLSKAGLVDVIAQGPGGLGSFGSGGAGGFIEKTSVYVPSGSNAVYIGAGGVVGSLIQGTAESSHFNGIVATGGGSGAQYTDRQPSGGACGGGSGPFASGNSGVGARFQGIISVSAGVTRGGNGAGVNGGGGGGVNGDGSGSTGGAGTTPDATWGSPGLLGRGGGGATMAANTGNGGNLGNNGNSGIILIRVLD